MIKIKENTSKCAWCGAEISISNRTRYIYSFRCKKCKKTSKLPMWANLHLLGFALMLVPIVIFLKPHYIKILVSVSLYVLITDSLVSSFVPLIRSDKRNNVDEK